MSDEVKDKGGRPKANIPWDEVDNLLVAGCSGREIAGYLGINNHTLYDRCLQDNGIMFSEYSQQKHSKGETILRAHQYAKAIGKTEAGDNTLLIWLGKTRLDQSERVKVDVNTNLSDLAHWVKGQEGEEDKSELN